MINIFYGNDRLRIEKELKKIFQGEYEVFSAEELELSDFPSIFLGNTLFLEKRNIVIKDLSAKKELFLELKKFTETEHNVVIFEEKIDKKTVIYKELGQNKNIRFLEFKLPEKFIDRNEIFNIFEVAMSDGKRAVRRLQKIKEDSDPYAAIGAWATKAITYYQKNPTKKTKRALLELAKIDRLSRETVFSNNLWEMLEFFLLELSSF